MELAGSLLCSQHTLVGAGTQLMMAHSCQFGLFDYCAFVGVLHKSKYSLNTRIWNIRSLSMLNRQNKVHLISWWWQQV